MTYTAAFWRVAAERAIKSAGQAGALVLAGVQLSSVEEVVSTGSLLAYSCLGAASLSLFTSIGSARVGPQVGNPSLVTEAVSGE